MNNFTVEALNLFLPNKTKNVVVASQREKLCAKNNAVFFTGQPGCATSANLESS